VTSSHPLVAPVGVGVGGDPAEPRVVSHRRRSCHRGGGLVRGGEGSGSIVVDELEWSQLAVEESITWDESLSPLQLWVRVEQQPLRSLWRYRLQR